MSEKCGTYMLPSLVDMYAIFIRTSMSVTG